jgi:hypothetical protein
MEPSHVEKQSNSKSRSLYLKNIARNTFILMMGLGILQACIMQRKNMPNESSDKVIEVSENSLADLSAVGQDPCQVASGNKSPPYFLSAQGLMVTRMLKTCITRDGIEGYEKNSPWMAMGFPCTGGGGEITRVGSYGAPKMVAFDINTSCPMQPKVIASIEQKGVEALHLDEGSKLIAFTPFAVKYWELIDENVSDVGSSVELRIKEQREKVWADFRLGKPIPVRLYGRENTFFKNHDNYYVEADIIQAGYKNFRLMIHNVVRMTSEEIDKVKKRCLELRPKRNCSNIF